MFTFDLIDIGALRREFRFWKGAVFALLAGAFATISVSAEPKVNAEAALRPIFEALDASAGPLNVDRTHVLEEKQEFLRAYLDITPSSGIESVIEELKLLGVQIRSLKNARNLSEAEATRALKPLIRKALILYTIHRPKNWVRRTLSLNDALNVPLESFLIADALTTGVVGIGSYLVITGAAPQISPWWAAVPPAVVALPIVGIGSLIAVEKSEELISLAIQNLAFDWNFYRLAGTLSVTNACKDLLSSQDGL